MKFADGEEAPRLSFTLLPTKTFFFLCSLMINELQLRGICLTFPKKVLRCRHTGNILPTLSTGGTQYVCDIIGEVYIFSKHPSNCSTVRNCLKAGMWGQKSDFITTLSKHLTFCLASGVPEEWPESLEGSPAPPMPCSGHTGCSVLNKLPSICQALCWNPFRFLPSRFLLA